MGGGGYLPVREHSVMKPARYCCLEKKEQAIRVHRRIIFMSNILANSKPYRIPPGCESQGTGGIVPQQRRKDL
jgi:hypothetical protein